MLIKLTKQDNEDLKIRNQVKDFLDYLEMANSNQMYQNDDCNSIEVLSYNGKKFTRIGYYSDEIFYMFDLELEFEFEQFCQLAQKGLKGLDIYLKA